MKYSLFIILFLLISCQSEPDLIVHESVSDSSSILVDSSAQNQLDSRSVTIDQNTLQISDYTFLIHESSDTLLYQGIEMYKRGDEAELLAKDDHVTRIGDSLIFTLKNGSETIITNTPIEEQLDNLAAQVYTFQGSISTSNYWELYAVGYEYHWFVVINKTTGIQQMIQGKPILSPNGKILLGANGDMEAGYTVNGFELYKIMQDSISLIGEKELNNWGPYAVKWLSDTTILITKGEMGTNNAGYYEMQYSNILLEMDSTTTTHMRND